MPAFLRTLVVGSAAMSAVVLSLMLLETLTLNRRQLPIRTLRWAYLVVLAGFICPLRPDLSSLTRLRASLPAIPRLLPTEAPSIVHTAASVDPIALHFAEQIDWAPIITLVYILGVISVLFIELWRHQRFKRTVLRWSRPADACWNEYSRARILVSKVVESPLLMGLLHPTIVLPKQELPVDDLRAVIAHEECHRANHDVAIEYALLLARALNWFNPLMPLFAAELTLKCEQLSDEMALSVCPLNRRAYISTILTAAAPRRVPLTTGFLGGKHMMKRRLTALYCRTIPRLGAFMLVTTLLLTLFVPALAELAIDEDKDATSPGASSNATTLCGSDDPASVLQDLLSITLSAQNGDDMESAMLIMSAGDAVEAAMDALERYNQLEAAHLQGITPDEMVRQYPALANSDMPELVSSAPETDIATRAHLMFMTNELYPELYAQLAAGQHDARSILCANLVYNIVVSTGSITQICEPDYRTRQQALNALDKWTAATDSQLFGALEEARAEIEAGLKAS